MIDATQNNIPPINLNVGFKGFIRVQTINVHTGKCRVDTGFFPNKILSQGKNNFANYFSGGWLYACQVGRNSTPPTAAQKSLLDYVAGTTNKHSTVKASNGVAPYYGYYRTTYRFSAGAAANENLSEVGFGWATSYGDNLVSRALIIDPVTKEATTVTPLPDEILDVTYEFRYYAPETDVEGPVITLNGVDYNTVTRPAEVTGPTWYDYIGQQILHYSPTSAYWLAYDGELGPPDQSPNGLSENADNNNHYTLAYQNNSYGISVGANIGANGWNVAAGIRSVRMMTRAGSYQTRLGSVVGDNPVPKTNSLVMGLRWRLTWAAINVVSEWDQIAASDVTTPAAGEWNTNVAGTVLRLSWTDSNTDNQRNSMTVETGSIFRIVDSLDNTKWVTYSVTGAYTEYASWTEYPVTQLDINNGGPTVGNTCYIRNIL